MKITDLSPALVWKYFHEVTQVPRPSKKEEKIIKYLETFAAEHKLRSKRMQAVISSCRNQLLKEKRTYLR